MFFLEGLEELTAGVSPTAQLDDICIPGYAVIDDIAVDFQIVALEQPLADGVVNEIQPVIYHVADPVTHALSANRHLVALAQDLFQSV